MLSTVASAASIIGVLDKINNPLQLVIEVVNLTSQPLKQDKDYPYFPNNQCGSGLLTGTAHIGKDGVDYLIEANKSATSANVSVFDCHVPKVVTPSVIPNAGCMLYNFDDLHLLFYWYMGASQPNRRGVEILNTKPKQPENLWVNDNLSTKNCKFSSKWKSYDESSVVSSGGYVASASIGGDNQGVNLTIQLSEDE